MDGPLDEEKNFLTKPKFEYGSHVALELIFN